MARVRRGLLFGLLVGIASCLGVVQNVNAEEDFLSEAMARKLFAGLEGFLDNVDKPTAVSAPHGGRQLRIVNTDVLTGIPATVEKVGAHKINDLSKFIEKGIDNMVAIFNATGGGFMDSEGYVPRNLDAELDDLLQHLLEIPDAIIEHAADLMFYITEARSVQATESYVQVMSRLKAENSYSGELGTDVNHFVMGVPINRYPCALAKHIHEKFGVRPEVIDQVLAVSRTDDMKTIEAFETGCDGIDECLQKRVDMYGARMAFPDENVLNVFGWRTEPVTRDAWNNLLLRLAVPDNPDANQYTAQARRVKQAYMRHLAREQRRDSKFGKDINTCLRYEPLLIEKLVEENRVPAELVAMAHPNKATVAELIAAIVRFDKDRHANKVYDVQNLTILNTPITGLEAELALANQYQSARKVKTLKLLKDDKRMLVWSANFQQFATTKLEDLMEATIQQRADLSDDESNQVVLYDFIRNNVQISLGTPELSDSMLFLMSTWRAAGADESEINVNRVARCTARQLESQHVHLSTLVSWLFTNSIQNLAVLMPVLSNSHYMKAVIPRAVIPLYWSIANLFNALRSYNIREVADLKKLATQAAGRLTKSEKWTKDVPRIVRLIVGPMRSNCLSGPAR